MILEDDGDDAARVLAETGAEGGERDAANVSNARLTLGLGSKRGSAF